ncbi:MAG TPA: hypothetical protein PKO06_21420, partial [Candidatus Ozemobacteraceae bacterium]|nr:hypothetical protein [Candidatus Ozemobacteraceae bacterium]
MRRFFPLLALPILVGATGLAEASAPSLSAQMPGMVIKEIKVSDKNQEWSCHAIQSLSNPNDWYCTLSQPQLMTTQFEEKIRPDLTFYLFQKPDPRKPDRLINQGVLTCRIRTSPPSDILE